MREIKFRGKRLDNGEWVVGSYIEAENRDLSIAHQIVPYESGEAVREVDPDTVGQFTGLKDRNAREIYEGDILKSARDGRLYVVKFWIGMFYASVEECNKGIFGGFPLHALTENEESGYECDIIGNIHDNPELLKTE